MTLSDTATFSGTYIWGTLANFDFSQNNAAQVTFNNPTFKGMGRFVCGSSVSGSATFDLGASKKLVVKGANLNGSTIFGDVKIEGSTVTTFTDYNVTGAMHFDTAGTYTLDGCTISEVTNSSGGNITINLLNGSTVTTNTGPNITILLPPIDVTFTDLQSGSQLVVYATGTTTEKFRTNNSGTSEQWTEVYTADVNYDVTIQKAGFFPIRFTNLTNFNNTYNYVNKSIRGQGLSDI